MTILGTDGDDDLAGTKQNDDFDLSQGGQDQIHAKGGADTIAFGGTFNTSDFVDGGAGTDTIVLHGNYASGLSVVEFMARNVEAFRLLDGFDYNIGFENAAVPAGAGMSIDASALGAHVLTFDATSDLDSNFTVTSGAGDDLLLTGGGDDQIHGGRGNDVIGTGFGTDVVNGDSGDDIMFFAGTLGADDRIDGGRGADQLDLSGLSGAFAFTHDMMRNVERINLLSGFDYTFDLAHLNAPKNVDFTVDASEINSGNTVNIDASGLRKYHGLVVEGGGANDVLTAGRHDDILFGHGGADRLNGGGGADTFRYVDAFESTSTGYDTIIGFDAHEDLFGVADVAEVDGAIDGGRLRTAHFDHDLAAAVSPDLLLVGHAVLFTPGGGDLAGQLFAVIERNATAGYQANGDIVILLQDAQNMTDFDLTNFAA